MAGLSVLLNFFGLVWFRLRRRLASLQPSNRSPLTLDFTAKQIPVCSVIHDIC